MGAILQATERTNFRRSFLKNLRDNGKVPGVVYGKNVETVSITISKSDLLQKIKENGRHGVFSINVNGNEKQVILTNYQEDPLTKDLLHVDLLAVDAQTEVKADVRITLSGEAVGVKDGGVLNQPLFELSITAKADQIPEEIAIDITNLKVGETVTVGDISRNYSFEFNHDSDDVIATILPPKQEEEISTGEEQEPGIPDNLEGREE
ncbi:50S ribosomal protein L25/general stress protein Ctc [Bacillus kwashiorkori]|uniref:50S ribosomal protein L25/general stress protein Ctc n=1 Tax=Bacillus kwashiorkori TaxID=1522318 RepID=UPI0007852AF7|nr:50S ribosomal protein L25/general stress protein Ctc [Bacillus kwashiorkori]